MKTIAAALIILVILGLVVATSVADGLAAGLDRLLP